MHAPIYQHYCEIYSLALAVACLRRDSHRLDTISIASRTRYLFSMHVLMAVPVKDDGRHRRRWLIFAAIGADHYRITAAGE
jgi:hypothetical protein